MTSQRGGGGSCTSGIQSLLEAPCTDFLTGLHVFQEIVYLMETTQSFSQNCSPIVAQIGTHIYRQWRIHDFPEGTPTYYLTNFPRNLHEIEDILAHCAPRIRQ